MHMAQVETWIRERAYAIWELEGRPQDCERQHWEQATRDVMSRNNGASAESMALAAKPAAKVTATKGRSAKGRKAA